MQNIPIYLDYAAATPCDPRVFSAMEPYFTREFYNPSSAYSAGVKVRQAYEAARAELASCLGAKPHEIILTAGATESINLAVQGVLRAHPDSNVVVSAVEHHAVMAVANAYAHKIARVDSDGRVSLPALEAAIDDGTVLVSIALVNSEIGTKQHIKDAARIINAVREDRQARGIERPLYLHTDASAAVESTDLAVHRLGVDLMTLSASKIYGPKQAGLLYVRRGVRLAPLIYGGGQEQSLRSGTENVAAQVGFAAALRLAVSERAQRSTKLEQLRRACKARLSEQIKDIVFTVPDKTSAAHILHFSIPGIDAERLLFMLDQQGIMIATGAACAANKQTASHVLTAIGCGDDRIQGSVRLSFGYIMGLESLNHATDCIINCVHKLKRHNEQ